MVAHARALPLWMWVAASLVLVFAADRLARKFAQTTTFLNVATTLLCLLAAGSAVSAHWSVRSELERSVAHSNASGSAQKRPLPDVYYIVLDGYGRGDTFERLYGFSDAEFRSWLESKGFIVAEKARSNYVQTELSLAATLNMAPIPELVGLMDAAFEARLVLDRRIDDSEVARRFKRLGYRYFAITSGFPALTFDSADVTLRSDAGSSLFLHALLRKTPYRPSVSGLESMYTERRTQLANAYRALERVAEPAAAPKFVVAHILAPHPPFVFGPNGEPRRPKKGPFGYWDGSHFRDSVGPAEEYREGYRDQAAYIAKLTKKAVGDILKATDEKAVIILQGDHGPKSSLDQNSLEKTDLREAFSILAAYRFPEGARKSLKQDTTPINTFRILLGELEGRPMPPLPDRSEFSTWDRPLELTDVTGQVD